MKLERALLIGAAAWTALIVVMSRGVKKNAGSIAGWTLITTSDVTLQKGTRYRGCIRLPFYAPKSLVRERLKPGVEAKGFRDVIVTESRASSWPQTDCDFYVEATWDRDALTLEIPGAVAQAWKGVAA